MATTESSALAQAPQDERAARWRAAQERSTRGLLLYNSGPDFAHLEGNEWAVRSSRGGFHRVDLDEETCTCEDFQFYGSEHDICCKHITALTIAHAHRRSGVREVRTLRVAVGDPFKAASRSQRPHACDNGWVYLGVEEDGVERIEAVPCRRCAER